SREQTRSRRGGKVLTVATLQYGAERPQRRGETAIPLARDEQTPLSDWPASPRGPRLPRVAPAGLVRPRPAPGAVSASGRLGCAAPPPVPAIAPRWPVSVRSDTPSRRR